MTLWQHLSAHPFPAILIVLDLCAVVWYAREPHVGRCVYWFCAAGITAAATWGMK